MEEKKREEHQKRSISIGGNVGGNVTIDDHHTTTDSSISNVTVGGDATIATGGAAITTGTAKDAEQLTKEDVIKLFQDMVAELNNLEVSEEQKKAAKKHLKHAVLELEDEEEPDKESVAEFLKKSTEILKEAGVTAVQAVSFGQLVGTAAAWLGKTLVWFGL